MPTETKTFQKVLIFPEQVSKMCHISGHSQRHYNLRRNDDRKTEKLSCFAFVAVCLGTQVFVSYKLKWVTGKY